MSLGSEQTADIPIGCGYHQDGTDILYSSGGGRHTVISNDRSSVADIHQFRYSCIYADSVCDLTVRRHFVPISWSSLNRVLPMKIHILVQANSSRYHEKIIGSSHWRMRTSRYKILLSKIPGCMKGRSLTQVVARKVVASRSPTDYTL